MIFMIMSKGPKLIYILDSLYIYIYIIDTMYIIQYDFFFYLPQISQTCIIIMEYIATTMYFMTA